MRAVIQSHIRISEEVYQNFVNAGKKKEAAKNSVLFQPQKVNQKCFLLKAAYLRGYRIIEGKDYTHHFFTSNWFATDFASFLTNRPSSLYIASLTKVSYYEFDKKILHQLYEKHHQLEKLGRIIAEKAYLSTVEKFLNMQTLDLKEGHYRPFTGASLLPNFRIS